MRVYAPLFAAFFLSFVSVGAADGQSPTPPERLGKSDLSYSGAFRLQRAGGPGEDRTSNGSHQMGYDAASRRLWVRGHARYDNYHLFDVANIQPSIAPLASISAIAPRVAAGNPIGGTGAGDLIGPALLDGGGGMVSIYTYYNVAGHHYPTLYIFKPGVVSGAQSFGPYAAGDLYPQQTAGFAGVIPEELRMYFPNGFHYFFGGGGNMPGTANNDNGLGLHLIQAPNLNAPPPSSSTLDVVSLVAHPYPNHKEADYKECDSHRGAVFIKRGNKAVLVSVVRKGTKSFYGKPGDAPPDVQICSDSKGYHCGPYYTELRFYDIGDLARSANGQIHPWDVQPFDRWNITDKLYSDCERPITGLAFDAASGRLMALEPQVDYVDSRYEGQPVIHVFQLGPLDTVAPAAPGNLRAVP